MASLLKRVKSKAFIHSHRKVMHLLDGEYGAIVRGRSMDFDDLRAYNAGDEVKDIDWKATARHGSTLVKRYVAVRRQNVTLVVDTGRNMAATGAAGEPKRDIAVLIAGVLGYLALKHGDQIALVSGDSEGTGYLPPRATEGHLERILRRIYDSSTMDAARSDFCGQLEFVSRSFPRRMILVLIADDARLDSNTERLLRRLRAQHEVLWIGVGDAELLADAGDRAPFEVDHEWSMPDFVRHDKRLAADYQAAEIARRQSTEDVLEGLAIAGARITREAETVPSLFKLLERHRHARR